MVYLVLAGGLLGFRLLGAVGVRRFGGWSASAAHALALMLVMTATRSADGTVLRRLTRCSRGGSADLAPVFR